MKVRPIAIAETMFLVFVFLLVNIRSFIFWSLYPPTDTIAEPAWREILLWLLTLVLLKQVLTLEVQQTTCMLGLPLVQSPLQVLRLQEIQSFSG